MDTIVASASAWGRSGVALLRLSGPDALSCILEIGSRKKFIPRKLHLCEISGRHGPIDKVLVAYMPAPASYTGEDVVEISCHGNPLIVELIIDACVAFGLRPARPGEFTRRALENNKLSMLQAEALNGLIHTRSVEGLKLAQQNLDGAMDKGVGEFKEQLLDICAELEARLDHPDDDLSHVSDSDLNLNLASIADKAQKSANSWRAGKIRIHGAKVAILGPVNSGKSSLFNNLVGKKRALVSNRPGTTRDVVEHSLVLDGIEICFMDMAGIRSDTSDPIEEEGIALGLEMAAEVDLCLILSPIHEINFSLIRELTEIVGDKDIITVGTHLDLYENPDAASMDCLVSNLSGDGIEELQNLIRDRLAMKNTQGQDWMVLSQRQHDLLRSVADHALMAGKALTGILGPAVAAEEITQALERLGDLSGEDAREDILSHLFSKFCIGK